eukprot:scaffold266404_cov22-Tisochrysis_lutea.AAC.1
MYACRGGNEACVRALIGKRAALGSLNARGRTALLVACDHGKAGCAKALIEAGAALDVADQEGRTAALMLACEGDRR